MFFFKYFDLKSTKYTGKLVPPPKTMYTPAQAVPHLFGLKSGEGGDM
jgi:hypothetical protein